MGLPETQNPLQIVACKGSWDSLELGETIIWWRWGGIEPSIIIFYFNHLERSLNNFVAISLLISCHYQVLVQY